MPKSFTTTASNSPPAKRRGRPLKEPSDRSTEVSAFSIPSSYHISSTFDFANSTKLQRARVRRAQKAFRTRKEQHAANLEEKCRTLESVVEEMTNEFLRFSDGLLRIGEKGNGGRDVDSYVKRELRGTMERFLELGKRAGRDPGEEEEEGEVAEEIADEDQGEGRIVDYSELNGSQLQDHNMLNTTSSTLLPQEPLLSQHTTVDFPAPSSYVPQHNANPYLNNIWTLPPSPSSDPSAIPYILAGRDSFAARLYFSIISSAVHSLRGISPPTLAQSFFRYKCRYVSPIRIQSVVDGVLNMLLHGTSQARAPTGAVLDLGLGPEGREWGGQDDEVTIKRAILNEVEKRGEKEDEFLATWGVEKYLRTKWRLAIDSTTVRVKPRAVIRESVNLTSTFGEFDGMRREVLESGGGENGVVMGAPTMIPGFEHSSQRIWDAGSLVERLLDVAVTIGEGPRWHYKQIDSVVETFLIENGSRN